MPSHSKSPRYLTKSRYQLAVECPAKLYYTGKADYPRVVWLLIAGHVLAALYHHVVLQDRTLQQMTCRDLGSK
ncbi:MAG: hypothetical protein HKO71_04365 [Pseudomonadales bacterium]|nr:hypothetical protein [Pseudomonadales bacterium]